MQQPEDKQVGFEDWALAQRTRPNEVLEKINTLVDLSEAERRLEATYSELGRPGHRAAVLLRVMLLQHLYGLSDPQAEAQLGDRLSFQKFVGLRAGEAVPDETAICRFRQRMIAAGLHERLLEFLNTQLAAAGYLVKRTTLVDATLVESSRTRRSEERRVGKECRSLCDWSSDVCSSDLRETAGVSQHATGRRRVPRQTHDAGRCHAGGIEPNPQIGRASCRERV